MEEEFNFCKEEYLALRREIEMILQDFDSLRRYSIGGVALAYTWLSTQQFDSDVVKFLAWGAPMIISVCALLIVRSKKRHMDSIGRYISKIENDCIDSGRSAQGWENYLMDEKKKRKGVMGMVDRADMIFWAAFVFVSFVISISGILAT